MRNRQSKNNKAAKKIKVKKELLEKAKAAKTVEELLDMARNENIDITEKEAAKIFADLHKNGELSDEEPDNVSGGCADPSPVGYATSLKKLYIFMLRGSRLRSSKVGVRNPL